MVTGGNSKIEGLTTFVAQQLGAAADPEAAAAMAAYMKTDMPFYGVKKPGRTPIFNEMLARFPIETGDEYEAAVRALWKRPHREEKYFAVGLARRRARFIEPVRLDLYRTMIEEGAWWDFVDEIAAHLVGKLLADHPAEIGPIMDRWIDDTNMWIRRTAILAQLNHKERTDPARLFRYCAARAHEREFFIRKAIGWALRQYARVDPDAVRAFVAAHEDELSGLSKREAMKHLS